MKRILAALILLCGTPTAVLADSFDGLLKDSRRLIHAVNVSIEALKATGDERTTFCSEIMPQVAALESRLAGLAGGQTESLAAKAASHDATMLQRFVVENCDSKSA